MKKTLFALAVALFCTTATTQAQNPNPGYNNGPGYYDDVYQNQNRYYGDDRDPWYDGRQHYDSRQYSRRWVVVAPPAATPMVVGTGCMRRFRHSGTMHLRQLCTGLVTIGHVLYLVFGAVGKHGAVGRSKL